MPYVGPLTITEKPESRDQTISAESPSAEIVYAVYQTLDDAEVRIAVELTAPAYYPGLPLVFTSYKIHHDGGAVWTATVSYSRRAPTVVSSENSDVFSFSTKGGTAKITQSLATRSYAEFGATPPDFKNAIGVNGDAVDGCDVVTPVFTFKLRHRLPEASITRAYLRTLYKLTGTTNKATWKGFPAGELLFMGAEGEQKGTEDPELTYEFAGSPNDETIVIGEVVEIVKKGWEYLWVRYEDSVSAGRLIKVPTSVHVEQVYEEGEFADLGIGS